MNCNVAGCSCQDSPTPLSERFCAICGHPMENHLRATQMTVIQHACTLCGCANFAGAPGSQFCATCGHGAAAHAVISAEAQLMIATQFAQAANLVPVAPKPPRAPFPTAKVLSIGGIAITAVVVIVSTTLALSMINKRAGNTKASANASLTQSQKTLETATKELADSKAAVAAAVTATAKLEKKIRNAKGDRARLPRKIAGLRSQQRQLRELVNSADYKPRP